MDGSVFQMFFLNIRTVNFKRLLKARGSHETTTTTTTKIRVL